MTDQKELTNNLANLVQAIQQQTKAIQSLADSNMQLIAVMAAMDDEDYNEPGTFLDGRPIGIVSGE